MKVKQISIFLENKTGRLASVTRLLGTTGINIRALSMADTSDFGILRMIVDNVDAALEALKNADYTVSLTDVVAIEIPDTPGGLADVLESFQNAGMNVEYLYAFVEKTSDKAVVVFRFEDVDKALLVLDDIGVTALSAEQVYTL